MKRWLAAAVVLVLVGLSGAEGAILTIPDITLDGVGNIFTPVTFAVSGDFLPTDTILVDASGTVSASGEPGVDLASGHFTVNAAGVIIAPGTTHTGHHPGEVYVDGGSGFRFGAVKIGNSSLGYFHLFPADASTGFGSPTPPTDISLSATLQEVFTGGGFTGLSDGTVLELSIHDVNTGDNSGAFLLSSPEASSSPQIPEPATLLIWSLLGLCFAGAYRLRRRNGWSKSTTKAIHEVIDRG